MIFRCRMMWSHHRKGGASWKYHSWHVFIVTISLHTPEYVNWGNFNQFHTPSGIWNLTSWLSPMKILVLRVWVSSRCFCGSPGALSWQTRSLSGESENICTAFKQSPQLTMSHKNNHPKIFQSHESFTWPIAKYLSPFLWSMISIIQYY